MKLLITSESEAFWRHRRLYCVTVTYISVSRSTRLISSQYHSTVVRLYVGTVVTVVIVTHVDDVVIIKA